MGEPRPFGKCRRCPTAPPGSTSSSGEELPRLTAVPLTAPWAGGCGTATPGVAGSLSSRFPLTTHGARQPPSRQGQGEASLIRGQTGTEGERVLRAPLRRLRRAPPRPLRLFSALLWSVAEPGREPRRHRSPHAASPRSPLTAGPGGSPWGIRHVPCPHTRGAFPGAGVASASWPLSAGSAPQPRSWPREAGALLGREEPQTPGGGGRALGPGPGKGSGDLGERQGWPRSWETAGESTSELQKCAVLAGKRACLQKLLLSNRLCKCLY